MKRSRLKDWRWWLGLAPKHLKFPPPSGDITILVPAFNEAKSIGLTILSLLRQTRTPDRIIVIDDCSTDGTGDIARQFVGVEVLRTPKNSGTKAQAINLALPLVRTEYVCVVDGDTLLKRDALEKILPAFHDDRVVAACGYVIPQKIRTFWERARFIEYIFSLSIYKRAQNHLGVVFVCSGCFSVFRTRALTQTEGFDPRTIAEDMDMTWGLMESGDEVAFVSDALCFPVDPPTLPILVSQLDRWYRGFLQCLLARRGRIRNWKLATLAYWYLADFVLGWVFLIGIFTWHTGSLAQGTVYAILIQFGVISAICSVKGVLIGKLGNVLRSLPCFFPMYFVNSFVLWRSIAFEVLLGRKLGTWSKGH